MLHVFIMSGFVVIYASYYIERPAEKFDKPNSL